MHITTPLYPASMFVMVNVIVVASVLASFVIVISAVAANGYGCGIACIFRLQAVHLHSLGLHCLKL